MIRSLRQRHRVGVLVLAVLVPWGLAAALMARKPGPVAAALPASLQPALSVGAEGSASKHGLWGEWPLESRAYMAAEGPPRVELRALDDLRRPDVLVYWSPEAQPDGATGEAGVVSAGKADALPHALPQPLPYRVWLLGRFVGTAWQAYVLPEAARQTPGQLLLYSLGEQQVLTRAALVVEAR